MKPTVVALILLPLGGSLFANPSVAAPLVDSPAGTSTVVAQRRDDRPVVRQVEIRQPVRRVEIRQPVRRVEIRQPVRRVEPRRVWIPGHWEPGFLGIGRKWVEGHWENR